MPRDLGGVPVAGAINGELADQAARDVGAEQLAAVPGLAGILPFLLDFEDEAGRGGVEAGPRHAAGPRVPGLPQRLGAGRAARLQPPLRWLEVAEHVGGAPAVRCG